MRDAALGQLDAAIHGRLHLSERRGIGNDRADQLAALPDRLGCTQLGADAQQALGRFGQPHVSVGQPARRGGGRLGRDWRLILGVIVALVRPHVTDTGGERRRNDQGDRQGPTRAHDHREAEAEQGGDAGDDPGRHARQECLPSGVRLRRGFAGVSDDKITRQIGFQIAGGHRKLELLGAGLVRPRRGQLVRPIGFRRGGSCGNAVGGHLYRRAVYRRIRRRLVEIDPQLAVGNFGNELDVRIGDLELRRGTGADHSSGFFGMIVVVSSVSRRGGQGEEQAKGSGNKAWHGGRPEAGEASWSARRACFKDDWPLERVRRR